MTPQIRSACSGSFFADACRGVEPHSQESTFVELCFCLLATGFELTVYRLRLGEHVSEVGSLNLVSIQVCLLPYRTEQMGLIERTLASGILRV